MVSDPASDYKTSLKYKLHKHLSGSGPGRSHRVIHASDLMKDDREFCPREFVLKDLTGAKTREEFLPTALRMTFQIGLSIEEVVVDWFAEMGLSVGDWICTACRTKHEFRKRPTQCSTCENRLFKYEQLRFVSEVSGISGSVDTLVSLKGTKHTLVEIKTIDKEAFKSLAMPYAEHRWRSSLYPRLVEESLHPYKDRIDTTEALVFYVSKGGYGCLDPQVQGWKQSGLLDDWDYSPFKEFLVKRDDALTDAKVAEAQKVTAFRKGEAGIPKGVCSTSFCPRAKKCSMLSNCFSEKYKAEY